MKSKSALPPDAGAQREARAVLDALRRLVRGLHLYARHCEASLGLSAAQLFALRQVHEHGPGPMNLRALAQATLTDLSSVSVVAKRLEKRGLLESRRSERDRRQAQLSLTDEGRALLRRAPDPLQKRLVRTLTALPPARRRALRRDLERVVGGAGMDSRSVHLFFEDEP